MLEVRWRVTKQSFLKLLKREVKAEIIRRGKGLEGVTTLVPPPVRFKLVLAYCRDINYN